MSSSLRTLRIVFGLCLALPGILCLIPSTRWAAESQIRRAVGNIDWKTLGLKTSDSGDAWMTPDFYDRFPDGGDRDSQLVRSSNIFWNANLGRLYATAKGHWDDPAFLSNFLLTGATLAPIPSPIVNAKGEEAQALEKIQQDQRLKYRQTWAEMVEVCRQGAKIEPANAFYPALAATLSSPPGVDGDSLEYLSRAERCSEWNDHAVELTAINRRTMRRTFGYRGWDAINMLAVPPCAWQADLSRFAVGVALHPERDDHMRATRSLLHVAELIFRSSNANWYGENTASASGWIVTALANGSEMPGNTPKSTKRRAVLWNLSTLSREADTADLREMVAATDFRQARGEPGYGLSPSPFEDSGDVIYVPITHYGVGSMLLTTGVGLIALILLTIPMRKLSSGWPAVASMPALGAAAIGFCQVPFEFGPHRGAFWSVAALSLFYLILSRIAIVPKLTKPSIVAGIVVPAITIGGHLLVAGYDMDRDQSVSIAIPAWFFGGLLVPYFWRLKRGPSRFFLFPQAAVLVLAVACIGLFGPFASLIGSILVLALMAGSLMIVVAAWQGCSFVEAARQVRRYSYVPAGLALFLSSGAVIWQAKVDPEHLSRLYQEEAITPEVRIWAHSHPDGALALFERQEATHTVPGGWP